MVCSSKTKGLRTQVLILFLLFPLTVFSINFNSNSNGSYLSGIRLPDHAFSTDCNFASSSSSDSDYNTHPLFGHQSQNRSLRLHLRHPSPPHDSSRDDRQPKKCDSILESTLRDLNRIHTFRRRITENKNTNPRRGSSSSSTASTTRHLLEQRKQKESDETVIQNQRQLIMGTLKSGVTLGSGEYLMDVYIGTPPRKFSLIVDTGSDLNWIQCVPCYDCFQQDGSYYDPLLSSSFKNISCHDPRCRLVSSPDPPGRPCGTNSSGSDQSSCPYFYWYGDSSNTTGDFAIETFTVNLTGAGGGRGSELRKVEDVMFGCGHWNRGLFHGAAGLLGLGRGPLSFATQLQSLYGHSFSYCLVDRYSDYNITSKLIFGEDKELLNHPQLNFTSLVDSPAAAATAGNNNNNTNNNTATTNPAATFYYVQIKSVLIDGQVLPSFFPVLNPPILTGNHSVTTSVGPGRKQIFLISAAAAASSSAPAISYQKFVDFALGETKQRTQLIPSPLQESFGSIAAADAKTELKFLSFEAPKIRILRSMCINGNEGLQAHATSKDTLVVQR